jgi:hypothetical protein
MKVIEQQEHDAPLIRLRDLAFGEACLRTNGSHRVTAKGECIVRVDQCTNIVNVDADRSRDTLVFNPRTGRCWFADGDELVTPVAATLTYTRATTWRAK